MKLFKSNIVSMALCAALAFAAASCSPGFDRNGLHMQKNSKGVSVVKNTAGKTYSGRIVIPDSIEIDGSTLAVTEIANDAFAGTKIESVIIPRTVERIGSNAFSGCAKLKAIHCQVESPLDVANTTFNGVDVDKCTLYVPITCSPSYGNANEWNNFNIREEGSIVTPIAKQ